MNSKIKAVLIVLTLIILIAAAWYVFGVDQTIEITVKCEIDGYICDEKILSSYITKTLPGNYSGDRVALALATGEQGAGVQYFENGFIALFPQDADPNEIRGLVGVYWYNYLLLRGYDSKIFVPPVFLTALEQG